MDIRDLIEQKKNGLALSREEIGLIIYGYSSGKISDSKIIEFMRVINSNNFSYEETYYLADAMARTGKCLNLKKHFDFVVDKHSAGSYSDSSTLIFMSVLAELGVKNVKLLSDKYGEYGNTLDRFNVFKKFNAKVSENKLVKILTEVGAGVIEDSGQFAPVDSKLYALRKKYNIVNEPIIAASILSKKIATSSNVVVYDVKSGEGAIYPSKDFSITLSKYLVEASKLAGISAAAVISDLNQPLGASIGSRTEVEELITVLRSERSLFDASLLEVAKELVIVALLLTGKASGRSQASEMFDMAIKTGNALDKFRELLSAYGGVYEDFKHTPGNLLDGVAVSYLTALDSGYVNDVSIEKFIESYKLLCQLKGGKLDKKAGLQLMVREGVKVNEGDKLVRIFYSIENRNLPLTLNCLKDAIYITKNKGQNQKVLHKIIM